jgi:hypothetical protein
MNTKKELQDAITREVAEWPGATVEFVEGGKHPKAKIKFAEKLLSVPFSGTSSDPNIVHVTLGDMRRALKKLGAERPKPTPTKEEDEAPYRKPNDGAAKRPDPVARDKPAPEPTVAEKLVDAGAATTEQALAVQTSRSVETSSRKAQFTGFEPEDGLEGEESGDAEADAIKEAFLARVAGIQDGVYFGLPADVYHAVPRLSSSGCQKIDVSPATFWRGSWLDPERPDQDEDETVWQVIGRAYHCARLEPHLFESSYVRELDKADAPKGTLFTGNEMGAKLEAMGLKKSGSVGEQAERLADAGWPASQLWPLIKEAWEGERGTRTPLPAKHYDQMITDRDRISGNSQIAPLLTGGEAEVSVFWTDEHGVRMKSRLDYLTRDWWVDFKTFDNSRGKNLNQALVDAVRYNRYYMQAPVYREAVEAIRIGGLDVIEAETDDQRALVAALRIKPGELRCWYVFQEKGGVPNLLAREFPFYRIPWTTIFNEQICSDADRIAAVREATKERTEIFHKGAGDVLRAKQLFVLYSQVYPEGEPWFPLEAVGSFSDEDFHPYWLNPGLTR